MEPSSNRPGRVNAPLVIGIIILAIGAWWIIARAFDIRLGNDWWPLIFVVPGLAFLALAFSGRRANPGIAVAGAIVATLGGILLFQTATNHWITWVYVWALFPLAAGLALMAAANRNGDEGMARSGLETARWAAIVFVSLLVFVELFVRSGLLGFLVPIALVLIGGYMIWQQMQRSADREASGPFGTTSGRSPTPPPPVPPVQPTPPSPSRARPWENETGPSVMVTPPPAPVAREPVEPPAVIVTPPPPAPPPVAATPAPNLPTEPFPADDLPPDPAVPVPTAPFPVDEGSAQIEAARKRTRTPRPRTPKAP